MADSNTEQVQLHSDEEEEKNDDEFDEEAAEDAHAHDNDGDEMDENDDEFGFNEENLPQLLQIMVESGLDPVFSEQLLISCNYDLEAAMNAAFDVGGPEVVAAMIEQDQHEEEEVPGPDVVASAVEPDAAADGEMSPLNADVNIEASVQNDEPAQPPPEMENVPAIPLIPSVFEDDENENNDSSESETASEDELEMPSFFQAYDPDMQQELEFLMLAHETVDLVIPDAMADFGLTRSQTEELFHWVRYKAKQDAEAETHPEAIVFSLQEKQAWINDSADFLQDLVHGYFQNHSELNPEDFTQDTCRDCLHFLFSTYMSMYKGRDLSKAQTSGLINEVMEIFKRSGAIVNSQQRLIRVFPRLHRDFRNASSGSSSQKVTELLYRAVSMGAVDRVKRILNKNEVDVNAALPRLARRMEDGGLFRRHRARSSDPVEESRCEIFFKAIQLPDAEVAWEITSLLIEAKADLTLQNHRKQNALHIAVNARHPKILQKLLAMGKCDPMARDERGFTAEEESLRRNSQIDREEFHPIFVEYKLPKRVELKKRLLSLLEANEVVKVCMKGTQEIESTGTTKVQMNGEESYKDRREFTRHYMWDHESDFMQLPTKYEVGEEVLCIRKGTLMEPAKVFGTTDEGRYVIAWVDPSFTDDLVHPIGDLESPTKSNGDLILDSMTSLKQNLGANAYEAWSQMAEDHEFQPYTDILPIIAQWQQKREERVVWKWIGGKICDVKSDDIERVVHEDHAPYNEERMKMLCLLKRGVGFDTRGMIKKQFSADLAVWKPTRSPQTQGTWQWNKVSKFCGDILFALKSCDYRTLHRLLDSAKIEKIREDPFLKKKDFCFFGQLLKATDVNCEKYQKCLECLVDSVSKWVESNPVEGMWYLPSQATCDLLNQKIEGGEWDTEKHILKTNEACAKLLMKKLSFLLVLSCKSNDLDIYKNIANRLTCSTFYEILKENPNLIRLCLYAEQDFHPLDLLSMFDAVSEEEMTLRYDKETLEKLTEGEWKELVSKEADGAGNWNYKISEKRKLQHEPDPLNKTNGRAEACLDGEWVPGEVIFKRLRDKHYLFKADTSVLEHIWVPCDQVRPSKQENKVKETFKWRKHGGSRTGVGEIFESTHRITIDSIWSTFSNENAIVSKGAALYEVKFLEGSKRDDCYPQIGWANEKFEKREPSDNSGCGDCENSWAVDGHRVQRWHAKSEPWGIRWKSNSVISIVADMDKKEFHVGIDGKFLHPLGKIFDDLQWDKGLYPCLSGKNMSLSVRMYAHEQRFPLKKIAPLYQSVAANIIMLIYQCFSWKDFAYDVNEANYLPSKEEINIWRKYHEFDFLYDKLAKLKRQEPSVLLANCISRKLYKKASELFDLFDFEQLISHPHLKSGPLFADDILHLATEEAQFFAEKFFHHLRAKDQLGLDTLKTLARATFKNKGKFSTRLFTFFLDTCAEEVNEDFTYWFLNKLDASIISQFWDAVQRKADDQCLILSNLLRDTVAQLERFTSEMTTIDPFTKMERLSLNTLEFIRKELQKARGSSGITPQYFKDKLSLTDEEAKQKINDIMEAGDASKQKVMDLLAQRPSQMTAAFNSGVFGSVPFACFERFSPPPLKQKETKPKKNIGGDVSFLFQASTAAYNTGVFGSVPQKSLDGFRSAPKTSTAAYNSGIFGSVSGLAFQEHSQKLSQEEAPQDSTSAFNSGIFGSIGTWCLDPKSAKSLGKLKKPEKMKKNSKKKKKKRKKRAKRRDCEPNVGIFGSRSAASQRRAISSFGRIERRRRVVDGFAEVPYYQNAPPKISPRASTSIFSIETPQEVTVKPTRTIYPGDVCCYYKDKYADDPEGTLREIEALGYLNERAKEGFNLSKMLFNVLQAVYGVVANAKDSYNLYFALPTEKDFDAALSSGCFVPSTVKKLKETLEYLWPREKAFRDYSSLLSSDLVGLEQLMKGVKLKELSHLVSRPMFINDFLHAKLNQALTLSPKQAEFDSWPRMISMLCDQLKSEIVDEESPFTWFNTDTRHNDFILTEHCHDLPKVTESFRQCLSIIKEVKFSLAVEPFFEYLELEDQSALYELLREVSFADLMSLETFRGKQPLRIAIENFLRANPAPKAALAQVIARFDMGRTWYNGVQLETEDDKVDIQFSHGDHSSIPKHQVRSFVGSQHENERKAIFMEGEDVEATLPNVSGKTNGMWYEGKVLSVLDETGEYEIELMLPKHLCKTDEELELERVASFAWPAELHVNISLRTLRFKHVREKGDGYPTYMCFEPDECAMQKLRKKDKNLKIEGEWSFGEGTAVFEEGGVCKFAIIGNGTWSAVNYEQKGKKQEGPKQRWQFYETSGWRDYTEDLNMILREGGGVGVHQYIAPNGHEYEIDLDAMTQRNVHTGMERQIRLVNGSNSEAGRRPMPAWMHNLPQDAHLVLREAAAMAGPNMPPDAHMLFTMQYGLTPEQIQELMDWYFRKPDEKQLLDTWDDEPDNETVSRNEFVLGETFSVKHRTATHEKHGSSGSSSAASSLRKWMEIPYCQSGTLVAVNEPGEFIVLRVSGKECAVPCTLVKRVASATISEKRVIKKIKLQKRFVRSINPKRVIPRDSAGKPMLCAVGECEKFSEPDSPTCKWCSRSHISKVDPYFHFSADDPEDVLCYSCYNYSMELFPLHLRDYANSRLYKLPYSSFWRSNKPTPEQISCFHPWLLTHIKFLMQDNLYSMSESPLDFEIKSKETKLCEAILGEFNRLKSREQSCRFVHLFQECSEKALDILPQISILQLSELGQKDIGQLLNDTLLNVFSKWSFSMNKANQKNQPCVSMRISKTGADMNLRQVEAFRVNGEPFILRAYDYASIISDSVESQFPAETLTDGKPGRVVYCKPLQKSGKNQVEFEFLHCKHPKEIGSIRINADGKHQGIRVEILENGVVISSHVMQGRRDVLPSTVFLSSAPVDLQEFFGSFQSATAGSKWAEQWIQKLTKLITALHEKLKDEVRNCDSLDQLEVYSIRWLQCSSVKLKQKAHSNFMSILRSTVGTLSILNSLKDTENMNHKAIERILNANYMFKKKKPEADWMNFLEAVFRYPDKDSLFMGLYADSEAVQVCRELVKRLEISFEDPVDFRAVPPMIQRVSSIIQEEKKRRNLLKDVKATKAAATQHVILTHMAKNLDIRSLSVLMKKNVEGFGLQSPDGPSESCIAALIQAYFFEKTPKPPGNYFRQLCEDIIERMISLEMWQELLHVVTMLQTKSNLPSWITSKMNLINAINTIWSKVHFLQRQAIHDFLAFDTASKVSSAKDVINLLEDLQHHEVISTNIRSILSLQPSDRLDALERIGVSNDNEDDDLCNICYQLPEDTKLSCKHWICSGCFLRIQSSPEPFCPFCRTPFSL